MQQELIKEINSIDEQLCNLLNRRMELIEQIPPGDYSVADNECEILGKTSKICNKYNNLSEDIFSAIICYSKMLQDNNINSAQDTCKIHKLVFLSFDYIGKLSELYDVLRVLKLLGFELNKLKVKEDLIKRLNGVKNNYKIFAEFIGKDVPQNNIEILDRIKEKTKGFKIIYL